MSESASINSQKKKTWSRAAIQALLGLIKERDLLAQLDDRRRRKRLIFEDLATREEVKKQCKYLKRQYYIEEERKMIREKLIALQQEVQADREIMKQLMLAIDRLADVMQKRG